MKVLRIGITGRKSNPLAVKAAKAALELLAVEGARVEVNKGFLKGPNPRPLEKMKVGVVLSFGGDGTLLEAFRELPAGTPVMGVNCGNRGFLQAYNQGEFAEAVRAAVSGKFRAEERTRIEARVDGKKCGKALNEVLVVPAKSGRLLRYRLAIGNGVREEAGDGLIVATPTGSTAHALSAGGPMVRGNAAVFVVVSINPVDWKHRPLVINDHEKVVVSDFGKMAAEMVLDGQKWFPIKGKVELVKGRPAMLVVRE